MICPRCQTDVEHLSAHLVGEHSARVCVLCARHGRAVELESGHCCRTCRVRLDDALVDIVRLAADAAAWIQPRATGSAGRSVPASRPPLNLDAVDPELTLVRLQADDSTSEEPLLWVLESWERLIRDERHLTPYGPASGHRNQTLAQLPVGETNRPTVPPRPGTDHSYAVAGANRPDQATLTAVVRFLRAQLDYAASEPTFGLEQFADEIGLCRRALARWDHDREGDLPGVSIPCPTVTDHADCGYRLRVVDLGDHVHCPRCGAERSGGQLVHIAMTADDGVWLSAVDAARWLGISESTLRRRANAGRITRRAGRYLVRHERAQA